MAGWTTVDDFETGAIGVNWSGSDAIVISSTNPLEETYSVVLDTDADDYVAGEISAILHTRSVSRNSDGDKTVRCLLKNTAGSELSRTSLIFFATDSDNYYRLSIGTDKGDYETTIYLDKIVSGVVTNLSSHDFADNGTIQILGVEIKAETNLITAYTYTDSAFSTSTGTTISTADTTYSSGYVGIDFLSDIAEDQGINQTYKADYIQYYDAGSAGTNTQINIGDTWKEISAVQINIGDTWKAVAGMQVNIGDAWKTIF